MTGSAIAVGSQFALFSLVRAPLWVRARRDRLRSRLDQRRERAAVELAGELGRQARRHGPLAIPPVRLVIGRSGGQRPWAARPAGGPDPPVPARISARCPERLNGQHLAGFAGFWIAPGSPYRSMRGALHVIRYAREHDRPLLGTCGGFQHVVLDFARNVLRFSDAAHAEYDPYASNLFITTLSCSLVSQTMTVKPRPSTRLADIDAAGSSTEHYYCNFGLSSEHIGKLADAGLVVSGVDQDGEPRVIEVTRLRYFIATLFVPQTSSTPAAPRPVITSFLRATQNGG